MIMVRWHDLKLRLLYRLVVVVVASATTGLATLDMDAHLRVNATCLPRKV